MGHDGRLHRQLGVIVLLVLALVGSGVTAAHADGPTDFANASAITITSPAPAGAPMPASPYPSAVTVSGMDGPVTDIDVHLFGFSHAVANDADIMLVGPTNRSLVLLSDAGGSGTLVTANNADVTFDDSAAAGVPQSGAITGTVRYRPTDTDAGETRVDAFPAPAPAPSADTTLGQAFTGTNPNGAWNLYVVDDTDGDNGAISGGWSLTVTTAAAAEPTTTTVVSSQNPSTTGGSVTFTATVTSAGSPVTDGTVTFTEGPATLAANVAVNASGQASFTTGTLTEGSHLVTATYNGTATLLSSSGSLTQVVDNPTTTPDGDTWCNTGNITVPTSGASTPYPSHITVSGAGAGIALLTVDLDDVAHAVPVDLEVLLVSPTGRNIVLMSDVGGTTPMNADLTFADSAAAPIAAGGPVPAGTYLPSDDDTDPDAAPPPPAPAPSAATTLASFDGSNPNGVWSLFVHDDASGDAGSVSGWCLNVSSAAPTATAVQSSVNPSTVGQDVTFTATVTSGGSPVTTGTVDFTDGATALATGVPVDASGQARLTTSTLAVGSHPVTASYNGTLAFQPSEGTLTQEVTKAPTATALTASVNPSAVGQAVTFTATVTRGTSPVTAGEVEFSIDGSPAGTVALDASGEATSTTSTLTAGTHTVLAEYTGTDALAVSSDTLDQVVELNPTDTEVTSSPNPSTVGQDVTFTATVTSGGSAVTTGTVDFTDGATAMATGVSLDASGTATFTTSTLAVGSHPVTATYSRTAALGASDGTVTHVVQAVPVVTTDPVDQAVAAGADASFTAAASGQPTPSVQWQVDTGAGFADLTGATATTLLLPDVTVEMDGNRYRAVFTNVAGSATTAAATLTITCPPGTSPTVTCTPVPAGGFVMRGTGAAETFVGSPGPDRMIGLGGNDVMRGQGGADVLVGSAGRDRLTGGLGRDLLTGDLGADTLRGGPGADVLRGGPGPDRLFGGSGPDRLTGDLGADVVRGGPGADVLRGGPGPDRLSGGPGPDRLFGGPGRDRLSGDRGADVLRRR